MAIVDSLRRVFSAWVGLYLRCRFAGGSDRVANGPIHRISALRSPASRAMLVSSLRAGMKVDGSAAQTEYLVFHMVGPFLPRGNCRSYIPRVTIGA
jgi:hypothetical protein